MKKLVISAVVMTASVAFVNAQNTDSAKNAKTEGVLQTELRADTTLVMPMDEKAKNETIKATEILERKKMVEEKKQKATEAKKMNVEKAASVERVE